MRTTKIIRIAAIACSVSTATTFMPAPAHSQALMENLAALAVAARWCKDYTVDLESGLKLALSKGMNPTKSPYNKSFDAAKEKLENILAETGLTRFCSVSYDRYKPGGPVPGFMVKN